MSIAAKIRNMYDSGEMNDSPEDKKRVAAMFGITVQTVHATLKNHIKESIPEAPAPTMSVPHIKKIDDYLEVKELVINRYDECYEIARSKGFDLPKIDIRFDLKGVVAGMFCTNFGVPFFRVNLVLAKENIDDYLKRTIPHEFSHYIVRNRYKDLFNNPKSHGYEWKRTMVCVFGLSPERCHRYDTTNAKQRQGATYTYKCGCMTMEIGAVRHRRIQLEKKRYICRRCRQLIFYVEK